MVLVGYLGYSDVTEQRGFLFAILLAIVALLAFSLGRQSIQITNQ
jgi:hypothetical protein